MVSECLHVEMQKKALRLGGDQVEVTEVHRRLQNAEPQLIYLQNKGGDLEHWESSIIFSHVTFSNTTSA